MSSGEPVEKRRKREHVGDTNSEAKRARIALYASGNIGFMQTGTASTADSMDVDDHAASQLLGSSLTQTQVQESGVIAQSGSDVSHGEHAAVEEQHASEAGDAIMQIAGPTNPIISRIPDGSLDFKEYKVPKVNSFAFNSPVPAFLAPFPIPDDRTQPTVKALSADLFTARTSFPSARAGVGSTAPVSKPQTDRQTEILIKFSQHPTSLLLKKYLVRKGAPRTMTPEDLPAPAETVTSGASKSPPLLAARVGSKSFVVDPAPIPAVPWATARNTAITTDSRKERQRAAADLTAAACYRRFQLI
jgi:hypothetical protein